MNDGDARLPGVIDTLGLGFAAIVAKPLSILPLALLELLLLLAPQVTVGALARDVGARLDQRSDRWDLVASDIKQLEGYTVTDLFATSMPLTQLPALAPAVDSEARIPGWHNDTVRLGPVVGLLSVGLTLVASVVVAAAVRVIAAAESGLLGDRRHAGAHRIGVTAVRITGVGLTAVALMMLVALPVMVATFIGAILGVGGLVPLWLILLVPLAWGLVHFYFSVHAVVVDQSGPLAAFKSSYTVVRHYFRQSVGFIALTLLISTGLTFALAGLANRAQWALLAVVLNAFLTTGMIVAAMQFYRDRARTLGLPVYGSGR
jgi:hypothetical protein